MQKFLHFSLLIVLLVVSGSSALAVDAKVFEQTANNEVQVTVRDGDFSATVKMEARLKLWPIIGEPVVNCFHRVTSVGYIYYKDQLLLDVPESVKAKTKVDFDAYEFYLRRGTYTESVTQYGTSGSRYHDREGVGGIVCQSGIDNGLGKWSSNFPGSPNWPRFMISGTGVSYAYDRSKEHYTDFIKHASYVPAEAAKEAFKSILANPDRYQVSVPHVFPDYRGDLSAVQKWYEGNSEVRKKIEESNKGTSQALGQLDDLFADIPEEQQARRQDVARQEVLEQKANDAQHQKMLAERNRKLRQLDGFETKLSQVKKGSLKVSKSASDPRERYMALFIPPEPAIRCYEAYKQEPHLCLNNCFSNKDHSRFLICVDENNYVDGIMKEVRLTVKDETWFGGNELLGLFPQSGGSYVWEGSKRITTYKHGCVVNSLWSSTEYGRRGHSDGDSSCKNKRVFIAERERDYYKEIKKVNYRPTKDLDSWP